MDNQTIVSILDENGVVLNAEALGVKPPGVWKVIRLKSGGYARIFEGKGKHARIATRMCGGNTDLYLPALMAQLVEFCSEKEGRPHGEWLRIAMEDFDEMPLEDYSRVIGIMGETFM